MQFLYDRLIRRVLQAPSLVEFGLRFRGSTQSLIEPPKLPMDFGVVGAEPFRLFQLAYSVLAPPLSRVCGSQVEMSQRNGRLNLNCMHEVWHCLIRMVCANLNVSKISQR